MSCQCWNTTKWMTHIQVSSIWWNCLFLSLMLNKVIVLLTDVYCCFLNVLSRYVFNQSWFNWPKMPFYFVFLLYHLSFVLPCLHYKCCSSVWKTVQLQVISFLIGFTCWTTRQFGLVAQCMQCTIQQHKMLRVYLQPVQTQSYTTMYK